jgi:hypothetical protein
MRSIVGEAVRVQVIAPLAIQSEQAIPAGTLLGVFDCLKCERGRYGSRSGQCEPPATGSYRWKDVGGRRSRVRRPTTSSGIGRFLPGPYEQVTPRAVIHSIAASAPARSSCPSTASILPDEINASTFTL